MMDANASYLVS